MFQPREEAEGDIREGMLVIVHDSGRRILGIISRIEAYHEFYEPGEVWSEALRQGRRPPDTAARKYIIAYIILQGILSEIGLKTVDKPPRPGSEVYEASLRDLAEIYGYSPGNDSPPSNIVEIGYLYGYHEGERLLPAVLDIDKMTMHLAVIGVTGSGKSNTIGVLIEELGQKNSIRVGGYEARTIPIIVFDANGDYLDFYYNPDLAPTHNGVYRLVFPHVLSQIAGGGIGAKVMPLRIDLNIYHERLAELSEIIYALTRGGRLEGIELQLDLLTRLLVGIVDNDYLREECYLYDGSESGRVDLNCVFSNRRLFEDIVLNKVLSSVAEESGAHGATVAAVKRALASFRSRLSQYRIIPRDYKEAIVNEDFVDDVTSIKEPKLVITDFSTEGALGVDLRLKQFIVSYMLNLFFKKFVRYRIDKADRVSLIIVEEAQNYAPNTQTYPVGFSVARNILALVATQGRKFGLSLALVTQRPSFVDPIVMSMMNTFIIHRVSPGDLRFVDQVTGGLPSHVKTRLPTLETGLAVIVGQMNVFPYPVTAKVRRRRSHRVGRIGG